MLRAELRKTWSRPLIVVSFLLVCLAQVVYVSMNRNSGTKELSIALNEFGGQMDDTWKNYINTQYENLWESAPKSAEDLWDATPEQRAILIALDYTFFTHMLDAYVDMLDEVYDSVGKEAYAELRVASEDGNLVFGSSPAGESMANQYMVTWGFLIFMILLCVDQFSGEKAIGMVSMLCSTKQGRRKLFLTKFLTCQISALIVWATSNLIYALILTFYYGWGNLQSVVQDFSFNACPYNWNTGEYLMVILVGGIIASQLTALVIFLLARIGKTTQRSFALMGGVLVLPYLISFMADDYRLALWLPCLINSRWLWSGLRLLQLGNHYIHLWSIAGAELLLITVIATLMLHHFMKTAETDIDT
ncbi:MAG: hypothetical protein IJ716_13345 [Lachnospiraceae bacterium]|nr:hypothetical protein [Lachnospiraceae bacterium]